MSYKTIQSYIHGQKFAWSLDEKYLTISDHCTTVSVCVGTPPNGAIYAAIDDDVVVVVIAFISPFDVVRLLWMLLLFLVVV